MPFKSAVKNYVKKQGKRLGRFVKHRYYSKKKGIKVGQIVKDVAALKNMVNAEKKLIDMTIIPGDGVGQFTGPHADTGYYVSDITPIPTQGVTFNTRNGASIKLSSLEVRAQIIQQANTTAPVVVYMYIIGVKGIPQTADASFVGKFINQDSMYLFSDAHSLRNPMFYKNFYVIAKKRMRLGQDMITGTMNEIKDYQFNFRIKQHVHYNYDANTVASGQLMLLLVADNGNNGGTAGSGFLGSTPAQTAALTGVYFKSQFRFHYYDN